MSLSIGSRLGPYQILAPLGAGGMGEVYKATDTRLGRTVAIKLLRSEHLERFEREARAIAALNHPHICTLHDIGPDYLVMEYLDGSALSGRLPVEEALRAASQIAGALEAAHAKGIVHRDLKPSNIMLTRPNGVVSVKLLDFGLAKLEQAAAAESTVTQTKAGTVLGTAAYMSPEQAEGKAVDARSDIFSFGLVLYEMLSGRRAFAGETSISTMAAILHREPEPLTIAPEIARIVTRCLRKAPAERFQSMAEVRDALAAVNLADAEKPPSIAVLPFANMSGDKENEYFSDGLAEEIINALTKLPGLKVTARTSAFAFKGKNEDIRRVGEALGVDHVLEGSVRKAGNRVRITAQLIAIADGCHLWSERYDREMTDIFGIQDEISQAIVDVLKVKLGGHTDRPAAPRKTVNQAAYHAYLEGRYHFQQLTEGGLIRSREFYERAIRLDPEYAAPNAGLAETLIYLTLYGRIAREEAVAAALAAADRAIALDPSAPEAYVARGMIHAGVEWKWETARRDFEKAIELSPESAYAHYRLGIWYFVPMRRFDEALVEMQRAIELDPLSLLVRTVHAYGLHLSGQNDSALEQIRSSVGAYPDTFFASFMAGLVLGGCGMLDEAAAALDRGLRAAPGNPWLLVVQAAVYGRQGNAGGIAGIAPQLPAGSRTAALVYAMVSAAQGDLDNAFAWLEKALEERQIWTVAVLMSPLHAGYFKGPRYDALMRRMNLS